MGQAGYAVNPADLIEVQARLSEGLSADSKLQEHVAQLLSTTERATFSMDPLNHPVSEPSAYAWLVEHEAHTMRAAHTFHASADMSAIVHGAAQQLASQPRFTLDFKPESLPTASGFVVLEGDDLTTNIDLADDSEQRQLTDRISTSITLDGFSWSPVYGHLTDDAMRARFGEGEQSGIRLTFYTSTLHHIQWVTHSLERWHQVVVEQNARDEQIIRQACDLLGTSYEEFYEIALSNDNPREQEWIDRNIRILGEDHLDAMRQAIDLLRTVHKRKTDVIDQHGATMAAANSLDQANMFGRYQMVPVMSMCWLRQPFTFDLASTSEMDDEGIQLLALAWTFFHMCGQTISTTEQVRPPRAAARRWRDMPLPKMVTVVRLRRSSNPIERNGEDNVVWHHRWLVRGHWRMQACGVGRTERRPTWIHGYVKGPEGLPLIVTNKVYDLVR